MISIKLSGIAILNINGADYCSVINVISKRDYYRKRIIIETKTNYNKFFVTHKMGKKVITFGYDEVEKIKFYQNKNPILINDVEISKIVVSDKVPFGKRGFKTFIWYEDGKKARPLCVMLPKMSAYRRDFDETRYMSFLMKNDELLKNIMNFGTKSTSLLKKDLVVSLYTIINK